MLSAGRLIAGGAMGKGLSLLQPFRFAMFDRGE
jgi:hypothetical protein